MEVSRSLITSAATHLHPPVAALRLQCSLVSSLPAAAAAVRLLPLSPAAAVRAMFLLAAVVALSPRLLAAVAAAFKKDEKKATSSPAAATPALLAAAAARGSLLTAAAAAAAKASFTAEAIVKTAFAAGPAAAVAAAKAFFTAEAIVRTTSASGLAAAAAILSDTSLLGLGAVLLVAACVSLHTAAASTVWPATTDARLFTAAPEAPVIATAALPAAFSIAARAV